MPQGELVKVSAPSGRETQIVSFKVGRESYGIPIAALHEIVRVPEITVVPDAPAHIEGVMDLRKRFDVAATPLTRHSRILVVEHRGRLAGMIVDSASEVVRIPEGEIEAAPSIMRESGLDAVTGLGKCKGRLIILLDIDKVLTAREIGNEPAAQKSAAGSGKAEAQSASAGK
jgi:purine-binding chemotaxis protein CheW